MTTDTRCNNKIAYHFVGDTLLDGRPIPADGEWLEHAGDIKLCKLGLHWSADPFDALQYAPGDILCRVEYDGETVVGDDKGVSRRRRIIKRIDAESLLREFARWAALQVIDEWDAPDIVRQYLITGDEKIRKAVWDAIGESAWASARDASRAAASAATWAATWAAAWAAAWAARDAASAASAAAWAAQRARFAEMVNAAFEEIEMKKMPEDLNAGFGLPKPSIHAAAHYSAFLTRYAQKQVDPAEAKALGDAAILIEILGQEVRRLEVQYVRADLAARPELQAAQPSIIEQIAQQWDGCNFDPMGETIDIGDAIRRAGKRLQTEALSQPQAEQQGAVALDTKDMRADRQPQGDGGAVLPGDLRWKLDNLRPSSCGTAGLSREEWDYVRGIFASPPVPFAWATHHDVPMLFLSRAEAAEYCNDDEEPRALYAATRASTSEDEA